MKLNTGKIAFPIEFDTGDKDYIFFNPSDPDLPLRMKECEKNINERIKDLKDLQLDANGEPSPEQGKEVIENFAEMRKIFCEELNKTFDSDISSVIFKHCSPFAIINGDYFVIQFFEAISPEIKKHIIQSKEKNSEKIQKYIDKYK